MRSLFFIYNSAVNHSQQYLCISYRGVSRQLQQISVRNSDIRKPSCLKSSKFVFSVLCIGCSACKHIYHILHRKILLRIPSALRHTVIICSRISYIHSPEQVAVYNRAVCTACQNGSVVFQLFERPCISFTLRPKYEEFFRNFGVHLKCGVCDEYGRYKDFLRDLLVFYTSEEHQITLKEYVENMPESQKAIYFASSDSVKHAMSLPQCDQVRARGYELIYLTSPLDEMVLENLRDQDGHPFCNVVTEDLGFETEEEKKAADERDAENKDFLDFVQQSVGGDLAKVKISRKLETLPCCLTTEGNITLEMEKYFRHGPSEEMRKIRATRVLELNANHKAFAALKDAYENDKDKAKQLSKILASLAELMAGVEIDDPAEFVAEVSELF